MKTRSTISTARRTLLRRGRDLLKGATRGTAAKGADVMEMLGDSEREELAAIHKALERIERGIFGCCGQCGARLSDERIEATPWSELCASCEASSATHASESDDKDDAQLGLTL
jgi:RNA polymerase-binding transcription factor DksA